MTGRADGKRPDDDVIDIRYYILLLRAILLAHGIRLIVFNGLVVALVLFYLTSLPPQYIATVTLHIAPKDSGVFNLEQMYFGERDTVFQDTQIGILTSSILLRQVAEKLAGTDLQLAPSSRSMVRSIRKELMAPFSRQVEVSQTEDFRLEETMVLLLNVISIEQPSVREYSNLVKLHVTHTNPDVAAKIANTTAEAYIDYVYSNEIKTALKNQTFLSERISVLRQELEDAERRQQEFRESEDIVARSSGEGELDQELVLASERFFEARQERLKLETVYAQVKEPRLTERQLQDIPAIAQHPQVSRIKSELLRLEQRKSELSNRYGSRHNKMIALESELETVRQSLAQQVAAAKRGIGTDYEIALSREDAAEQMLEQARGRKQILGRKNFTANELKQEVDVKRELYTLFLEKLNQDDASGPVRNTNLWIADPATVPRVGNKPSYLFIISFVIIVCTFIGTGVGVVAELIRDSIETEEDVEHKLGAHLIGLLPKVAEEHASPVKHYLDSPQSQFAESVRTLRTSVMLMIRASNSKTMLVTSSAMGEGKTTVAMSLASSMGRMQRVLLVDADLRRPSVEQVVFGEKSRLGLADVLAGDASFEDVVVRSEEFAIDVLCAGTISDTPLELIGSNRCMEFFATAATLYDVVIIDSPPCGAVSDGLLLGALVNEVVVVVKAHITRVSVVRSVLARLDVANAHVAGVLLNQVDFSHVSYARYQGQYNYDYGNPARTG